MNMEKLQAIALMLIMVIGMSATGVNGMYGVGDMDDYVERVASLSGRGTRDDPYMIYDVHDLQNMSNHLDAHYALANDIDAAITCDWNEGQGFMPIGNDTAPFTGTFDGRNYTINGLYINRTEAQYVGMFGYLDTSATVKNVGLLNVEIEKVVSPWANVGCLVAHNSGKIDNTYSSGILAGQGLEIKIGGLVGYNTGQINNSYSFASPRSTTYLGGLVGQNIGNITYSYFMGEVSGRLNAGGIAGYNVGNIYKSHSMGSVSGYGNVGGLLGINYGTVLDSYSNAFVNGTIASYFFGGLVGSNAGEGTISNSYATGIVMGCGGVGGLVGANAGLVTNSYATGDVDGSDHNESFQIGGFVGKNFDYGTISKSYSTGNVSGVYRIGGFVGDNYQGMVSDSYSTGSIVRTGSTYTNVGGFVGRNYNGTVINSYSTGRVTYADATDPINKGFCGEVEIGFNMTGNFWDIETSHQSDTAGAAEGKTTAEMKSRSTFMDAGWDFDETWRIVENVTYPMLAWKSGGGTLDDPYWIFDVYDLQNMSKDLSAHYALANDIDATVTSGWNGGAGFEPVGYLGAKFNGSLDGRRHTITGLYINRPSTNYIGLFGVVCVNGEIHDVVLADMVVNGRQYVGGIAGQNEGTIYNTSAIGAINGQSRVGGFTGKNIGTVEYSYSTSEVNGNIIYIGGFIGYNGGVIKHSYSKGNVSAVTPNDNSIFIGGLVGYNTGFITHAHSMTKVDGSTDWEIYAGGLVGKNHGEIDHVYSTGDVNGIGSHSSYVGGLVGGHVGIVINNSFSTGNMSGSHHIGGLVGGSNSIILNSHYNIDGVLINGGNHLTSGGIYQGQYQEWISNNLTLDIENYSDSLVPSGDYYEIHDVQGIKDILGFSYRADLKFRLASDIDLSDKHNLYIPYLGGVFDGNGHSISNVFMNQSFGPAFIGMFGHIAPTGSLKNIAVLNASISGIQWAGGLVGINDGVISKSYVNGVITGESRLGGLVSFNRGTIIHSVSLVDVGGSSIVGGLVARNHGIISESYSSGIVSGNSVLGGLVASNSSGMVYHSFWDIETSGQSTSDGGTGLTTSEMMSLSTFVDAGWDISAVASSEHRDLDFVWNMADGETYPFLSWETPSELVYPSVEITSPGNGEYFNSTSVEIQWSGYQGTYPISYYTIQLNEGAPEFVGLNTSHTFHGLSSGPHNVMVIAVDQVTNNHGGSVSFTVDTDDPTVTITSPDHGSYLNSSTVEVAWSADGGESGISHFEIYLDGDLVKSTTETSHTFEGLSQGENTVLIVAHDNAGNSNADSITFFVDVTPPTVYITYPSHGEWIGSPQINVTWVGIDENSGIDYYEMFHNEIRVAITTNTHWQLQIEVEGDHIITVLVHDKAGNTNYSSVVFHADFSIPWVNIESPSNNSFIPHKDVTLVWSGGAGESGLDRYEVSMNGEDWVDVGTNVTHSFTDLDEGTYNVRVRVHSLTGMYSTDTVTFTVDITPPEVEITSPWDGQWISSPDVTVTWDADGGLSGISHFEVSLDGIGWVDIGSVYAHTFTGLSEGIHTVHVSGFDNATNHHTVSVDFGVDITPPVVEIHTPEDNGLVSGDVTVNWTATDLLSGVSHISIRLNGGEWSSPDSEDEHTYHSLPDGHYSVDVRSHDNAGNSFTATVNFTVDSTLPQVSIETPNDGDYLNTSQVNVEWVGTSDVWEIVYYEVRIGEGPWIGVGLNLSHLFHVDDGTHSVHVRAHDTVGNNATASVTFTVDTVPPSVHITSPQAGSVYGVDDVTVEWEGSDSGSGISHYGIRLNGGEWIYTDDTTHSFSGLREGGHTVTVKAYDMANNSAVHSVDFMVDLTPPQVRITSPEAGGVWGTGNITIYWIAEDNITGIDRFEIWLNGELLEIMSHETSYNLTSLEEGGHTVMITAFDLAGNHANTTVSFVVDLTTPMIDIQTPLDGDAFANGNVTVTWTGSDVISEIARYEIRFNGGPWEDVGLNTQYHTSLEEGEHVVEVMAYDLAGNSALGSVHFMVDLTPPDTWLLHPVDGAWIPSDHLFMEWEGDDEGSGISHYEIRLNGGEWTYMGTETQHTFHDLPDGNHTVEVRAYDNAGNWATATASFTVDTVPPEIHHVPVSRWHMGDEVVIEANVRDDHILGNVTLHYSHNGISGNISMVHVRDGLYRAILAATNVETTLEYRISAVDMAGHVSLSETFILELLDLGQPEIRDISMGEFDVMPLNGTVIITFSKPMDVLGEPAITVEPNAIFSFKWTCERNLTISFYDLSPETEYVITVTGTSLVDTNGIFMGVDGTYRFTSQGFPEITSVQHIEEVRKGLEIVLQADIRSQVGLREVFLWYTCASGILNHIGANNTVGTLWEVTITAQNLSGVLMYGFSAVDISGLTVHSSEYQINITNPSWVSLPHDLNARAGKPFDFYLRVTNPVGVLMVVLHYTCPRGEERTIDMMRTGGEITDGIWNCRLNTDPGELTYRVEIMDIHGESIMLPETPATITVQESSGFLDGMFMYLLIMLILCAAIIAGVVLWKRRQEEEEEPEIEVPLAAEPTPVSAVVPEKAEDRCLICYGEMDDSRYLCPGCDNVYHEDCIRQVGDCPMCGGEVSSTSEDPPRESSQ